MLHILHKKWMDPESACPSAFWDSDKWQGDVREGQMAEEEVHRGVEVRVQPDEHDDEQFP